MENENQEVKTDSKTADKTNESVKTFTQEEVNEMINKRIERERKNQAEQLGWEIENTRYIPTFVRDKDESDKGNIIGFNSTIEFKPIRNTSVSVDTRRAFIVRNEYLENRFSKRKGL